MRAARRTRTDEPQATAGGLAPAGAGFRARTGLLLFWILVGVLASGPLVVGLLIARGFLIGGGCCGGGGGVLGGRCAGGAIALGRALQVADPRLELIDDTKVIGVADDARLGLIGTAHDAGWLEIAGVNIAEANAGEVHGQGYGKERHGGRHGKTGLQQRVADGTEVERRGDAAAEG